MKCDYCGGIVLHYANDRRFYPDDLPDDIPRPKKHDITLYHRWCFDKIVEEVREEIASKHCMN